MGHLSQLYAAGVQSALWLPLLVLNVTSVMGLSYYARVAIIPFFTTEEAVLLAGSLAAGSALVLALLALLAIWPGVYPPAEIATGITCSQRLSTLQSKTEHFC